MKKAVIMAVAVLCMGPVLGYAGGTQQGTAAPVSVTPPGTFPIVNEQATLSIFAPGHQVDGFDIDTNWFTRFYEEKTNVKVDFELVIGTGDQVRQRVNLKLASGDYPDVFSRIGFSRAEQVRYGSEGLFVPLEDLVDTHTVHIRKALEEVDQLRASATAPNGHMYGLPDPVLFVHGTMPNKIWVYQPWVDSLLGGRMPATTEEFYQMLKAFSARDPNESGVADEIPFATIGPNYVFLMNSFTWFDGGLLRVEDGTIVSVPDLDGYREGLRYIAKLYREGLYIQDFFTLDVRQIRELAESKPARVGAVSALWPGTFSRNLGADAVFWGYEPLMPLAGPDGTRQHPFRHLALGPGGGMFNVTSAAKSPELALRWLDWIWSFEGYHTISHGPELDISAEVGPGWRRGRPGEEGADGQQARIKRVPTARPEDYINIEWGTVAIVPRYLSYEWHTGLVIDADDPWRSRDLWQATIDMYEWLVDLAIPPLFMPEDTASEIAELETALQNAVREASAQFIFGSRNIDSDAEWSAYIRDLNRLGLDRLVRLYQREYDINYGR